MSSFRFDSNLFELEPLEIRRLLTTASVDGTNTLQILGTSSSETITVNRGSNGRITVTGVGSTFAIGSGAGQVNKINIQAGSGNDTILLTNNVRFPANNAGIPATVAGNNGNDTITTGPGNDVIFGGTGNDTIDGGVGNDQIIGQDNIDTTNYSNRTGALRISLNNNGDADGEVALSENDKVESEEVIGGAGNDTLIGSGIDEFLGGGGGADSMSGGAGSDEIIGSTGQDKLFGDTGDDYLGAQNNDRDTVNGGNDADGTDADLASVDVLDVPLDTGPSGPVAGVVKGLLAAPPIILADNEGSALDTSYGTGGKAVSPFVGWADVAGAVVDAQGRVYFAGTRQNFDSMSGAAGDDFVVARFTAVGAIDTAFGSAGVATIDFTNFNDSGFGYNDDDQAGGLTLDADGKVIVVGSTIRTFGSDSEFAIARLLDTGALDQTFNGGGLQTIDIAGTLGSGYNDEAVDAVVQDDDKIVIVGAYGDSGREIAVVRLTDSGQLDTSDVSPDDHFNVTGMATYPRGEFEAFATSVAIQPGDGSDRIIVAGSVDGNFMLIGLEANGAYDDSFAGDGVATSTISGFDVYRDVAVNGLGQIIAVGDTSNPIFDTGPVDLAAAATAPDPGEVNGVVAVWTPNADAAPTIFEQAPFTEGSSLVSYRAVVVDDSNRIVVAGTDGDDFIVARLLPNLTFDSSFNVGHAVTDIEFSDDAIGVGLAPGGKIIAAGFGFPVEAPARLIAVRYGGSGTGGEGEIDGIDEPFIDYDDLQQDPPTGLLADHFENVSEWAKLYMRSQPDDEGVARIQIKVNEVNNVQVYNIVTGDGSTNVAVNIDGLVLFYDPETTNRIEIKTGGKNDLVNADDSVLIPLFIDGGDGNDVLNAGGANDVVLGGKGNDLMSGNDGNDLLLGQDGNDHILGWNGNDLIIGGKGNDLLWGLLGDNIVIAGTTSHDSNIGALESILAEWTSGGPLGVRVNNIRNGGGLNGANTLRTGSGATVFNDGASDFLNGGGAGDWFFFKPSGSNRDFLVLGAPGTVDFL